MMAALVPSEGCSRIPTLFPSLLGSLIFWSLWRVQPLPRCSAWGASTGHSRHHSAIPGRAQTCSPGGRGYRMKDAAAAFVDKMFI